MNLSRCRKAVLAVCTICVALLSAVPSGASQITREWRFNVSLDDKHIGYHLFALREIGARRELTSEASFHVKILFINAYTYAHYAKESWQGSCLQSIDARTVDNGKEKAVHGEQDNSNFVVIAGQGPVRLPPCVKTFAYWNAEILQASHLLNPQTGEYVPITVTHIGKETLTRHDTAVDADRYRLVGASVTGEPIQIDLWYSQAGDWLALESITAGRHLRYQIQ